jgi:hypothetical protein
VSVEPPRATGRKLGFGGKFWVRGGQWFVNCYKEDITPERQEIIDIANKVLEEIPHD